MSIDDNKAISTTAEVNVVKSININTPNLSLVDGVLSTAAEKNVITSVDDRDPITLEVGDRVLSLTGRKLFSRAEVNVINDVDDGVLSLTGRKLFSSAEVNVVNGVDTNGNILSFDSETRILSATGSTVIGGIANGSLLLQLDSAGRISPTAFGQINLANTEVYIILAERNASTRRAWVSGDVAIITGDPSVSDPIVGTFAYQGADQTVAGPTLDSDWVEIATPTGTVSSVSGKVGVVVLAQTDIGGLENRLKEIEDASSTNKSGVASNDSDIGVSESSGIQGVFEDSGTTYTETEPGTGVYQDTNGNNFTGTIPDTFTTDPVDPILSTGIRSNLEDLDTRVSNKVDKDGTKVLSDKDFTTELFNKLDRITPKAQSDWTETVDTEDDYIKNKPNLPLTGTPQGDWDNYITSTQIPEGTPADNWDNYITSAQVAPKQTYVAMKLTNGSDLEIIDYMDGDTIDIVDLQNNGYELLESDTGSAVRVDDDGNLIRISG